MEQLRIIRIYEAVTINWNVLEFSHAVLGPTCGLLLADFGAEVIKIEPPNGDPTRRLQGFGMGYYPYLNRNKKSVVLNLKDEAKKASGASVVGDGRCGG